MKYYDLKNISQCYVCGSVDKNINHFLSQVLSHLSKYEKEIHPKEKERQEKLKDTAQQGLAAPPLRNIFRKPKKILRSLESYDNSVIIVSGNCSIGTKDIGYYYALFEKIEKHLEKNNCYIFFVRGNTDDPSIFNDCKIDFEHIKTIPDYSVVLLKHYNCLCIGGSISVDKSWKLFQEKEFGKKLYWENEKPILQDKVLDEILEKNKIQCVISNSCPSFAFPGTNFYDQTKWVKEDGTIKKSFIEERQTLDKIYSAIISKDSKPSVWFYGRFGIDGSSQNNDILFSSLAKHQIFNVNKYIPTEEINDKKKLSVHNDNDSFSKILSRYHVDANERLGARMVEAPAYNTISTDTEQTWRDIEPRNGIFYNPVTIETTLTLNENPF